MVTFAPQQPAWSLAVTSGGLSTVGQSKYGAFGGYPFLVAGSSAAPSVATPGDQFQLWNAGALKEPTTFTVAGTLLNGATYYVFFLPAPVSTPGSGNTAISLPAPKSPRWLGSIGHVTGLTRSYTCPGGPETLSLLLRLPPDYRTDALNPGRVVQVYRGGSCVWEGKLNEPTAAPEGWTVTAHGAGTYGEDFAAYWTTWNADNAVDRARSRGLRWQNPGIGAPSGIYLVQQQDPASETITAHLNLLITGGGLLWQLQRPMVSSPPADPWVLSVFPFKQDANGNPTQAPDRILISNAPVARTIAADINYILLRYQATADIAATSTKKAVAATFAITSASNPASVAAHGQMEYFLDVSSAGVMSATAARAIGQQVLTRFVRASFAGPFTASPGQVRTTGGQPVDLGCDGAGLVYQVMVTDGGYGGEVAPAPLVFMSGAYEYDEDTGTATITPFQSARHDLASLISQLFPGKFLFLLVRGLYPRKYPAILLSYGSTTQVPDSGNR